MADFFTSRPRMIALVVAIVLAVGCLVAWRVRDHADARATGDEVMVVSAPGEIAAHDVASTQEKQMPMPVTLDAEEAIRLVARNLPMLRDEHSACDAQSCTVSAEPSAAGAPLGEMAFSQLVKEDMPTILTRTGHGLLEPIQIEEIGPDQYRLQFRIARAAR